MRNSKNILRKQKNIIDKYRAGIKSKMARGRQSQLNRLERLEAPETSHSLDFKFPPAAMSADKVLVLDHVSIGYKTDDPSLMMYLWLFDVGESWLP